MNQNLINQFSTLASIESSSEKPNLFRIRAYKKIVKILKELKFEVTDSDQVKDIPGIGKGTIEKINEILANGHLKNLEKKPINNKNSLNEDTTNKNTKIIQKQLEEVTGIGPVKAKKLIKDGYTLEILRNKFQTNFSSLKDILTHHQILGIKYYDDLSNRIPYLEITFVDKYLQKIVANLNQTLFGKDIYCHQICGSFRRQAKTSGDIDVLFYNKFKDDNKLDSQFFRSVMLKLIEDNFLKDHLTDPNKVSTKYMGFCKLHRKKFCRRIDMRCINHSSLPAAQLYFTGSGDFNKNMRTFALKKGFTLNEYGIFKLTDNKLKGDQVMVSSENDIFNLLGIDFVEPKNRLSTVIFK